MMKRYQRSVILRETQCALIKLRNSPTTFRYVTPLYFIRRRRTRISRRAGGISRSCWINADTRALIGPLLSARVITSDSATKKPGTRHPSSTRRPGFVDTFAADALFIRCETRLVALVSHGISSEEISDSLDGSWMDENGRRGDGGRGRGACPRERSGTALRNFARRRPTGRQTRAMDEMLTRRETIDYSRQDRSRQVGREMVFLYQYGLLHRLRATLIEIRKAHLFPALRCAGPRKSQGRSGSNLPSSDNERFNFGSNWRVVQT